jgi:hypothetical protein
MEKCKYVEMVEVVEKIVKNEEIFKVENGSGFSFFKGKKRLLKVLKNKKSFMLEINVLFDRNFEKENDLKRLSLIEKKEKKLGSMWYYKNSMDIKEMEKFVKDCLIRFKEEIKELENKKELLEKEG